MFRSVGNEWTIENGRALPTGPDPIFPLSLAQAGF